MVMHLWWFQIEKKLLGLHDYTQIVQRYKSQYLAYARYLVVLTNNLNT